MNKIIKSKTFVIIVSFLGLYLLTTGASLAVFSFIKSGPSASISIGELEDARSGIAELPKTQACPINGGLFSKVEEKIWIERRPIIAMIENSTDARPQSGLSKADIVFEAVAEGGITRFMGVFYCGAAADEVKIAPVRSARIYFVNLAAGFGDKPIFMHVGGANDYSGFGDTIREARALEKLESMGWRIPKGNDFDTTYDSAFPVFWRDYERLGRQVATEHTMVASLDKAYEQAASRGLNYKDSDGVSWDKNFKPYLFGDESPLSDPVAKEISFGFWSNKSDYDVTWKYDKEKNLYLRYNGGSAHTDLGNEEQLSAKNVVVVFAKERGPVDRNKHMLYGVIGKGNALVFQNGDVIKTTWSKPTETDMVRFLENDGSEASFVGGTIWIEIVPAGNNVDY